MSSAPAPYTILETAHDFFTAINQPFYSVVNFSATWCGPCKAFAPFFAEVAKTNAGVVDFFKVDIDEPALQQVVQDADISSVPTFILYKDGKVQSAMKGAQKQEFLALVEVARNGNMSRV